MDEDSKQEVVVRQDGEDDGWQDEYDLVLLQSNPLSVEDEIMYNMIHPQASDEEEGHDPPPQANQRAVDEGNGNANNGGYADYVFC